MKKSDFFHFFRAKQLYPRIYIRPLCGVGIHSRRKTAGILPDEYKGK
jgi:hypothetical protein